LTKNYRWVTAFFPLTCSYCKTRLTKDQSEASQRPMRSELKTKAKRPKDQSEAS